MVKAIESGTPKMNIERVAVARQARIDGGWETIVGVNKYHPPQKDEVPILEVDNEMVRKLQLKKLQELKSSRDTQKVEQSLKALETYAKKNTGNALELAIEAVRARCTVGEITSALERHWGRYAPNNPLISGVYGRMYAEKKEWKVLTDSIKSFEQKYGRRPRMLVAKMGQDGHDRGAKVIATSLADMGFDIDLAPLFSTPEEIAKQAVENDVHVIGVSSQAAGHKTLVPQLIEELKKQKAENIIVVVGGVIPQQDYAFLTKLGVKGIFGPGTPISQSADLVLKAIEESLT